MESKITPGQRQPSQGSTSTAATGIPENFQIQAPQISVPKGGGALKSIDEKFQVNAVTGGGSFSIPLPFSPSRAGFSPSMTLSYDSGAGNSVFGIGWSCAPASIVRKTDKRLPKYEDANDSDVFMLSGAEDLVKYLEQDGLGNWVSQTSIGPQGETVQRYRPRTESTFSLIERVTPSGASTAYWKTTSPTNVVTFYGRSAATRIADPSDSSKIYQWLPDLSFDDKGNVFEMAYLPEDLTGVPTHLVHERNRFNGNSAFTNRYLKTISYGNKTPYFRTALSQYSPESPTNPGYFFHAVFDYGDHGTLNPAFSPDLPWPCRLDPFSSHRSGFEIRTYRMCQRVLFFHTFLELNPAGTPTETLVRALEFDHSHFGTGASDLVEVDLLNAARLRSYIRNGSGGYDSAALPDVTFNYHTRSWGQEVFSVPPDDNQGAPAGMSSGYQWLDFHNEGIPGIFSEQAGAMYFKANLGNGTFAPPKAIAPIPAVLGMGDGRASLQDLDGNGKKNLVLLGPALSGYFEQDADADWMPFRHFKSSLNINTGDPNVKFIDLNGDGIAEIVLSEERAFWWHEGLGTDGYGDAKRVAKALDEEKGPRLVFSDPQSQIYLADMCGDGLTDLVRIRNGEICYWANLGYGRFGPMVTMSNSPVFDHPDAFNPQYLQIADISGTGASDIAYFGKNTFRAWFNLSGNGWSDVQEIAHFPTLESPNAVAVVDFLGNGTGCLVWSSPLPGNATRPLRYIDLMGGKKPFILSGYANNFGKEVSITYRSSTQYYLEDKAQGQPWITKLPFPVQCVSETTTRDAVTGHVFSSIYSYHHGYYDHSEREFRGFGRVDQQDTQQFQNFVRLGGSNITDEGLYQDPVLTKTWFHTGAFLDRERILHQYAGEYYVNGSLAERQMPEPELNLPLDAEEWREALRACKGLALRTEVYALDGSNQEALPYTVTEQSCQITCLQPRSGNANAVFMSKQPESITYQYERNPADPRISHQLVLAYDEFGNPTDSVSVVYPRQSPDTTLPLTVQEKQAELHIVYSEADYTADVITANHYRLRAGCGSRTWEITGLASASTYFEPSELRAAFPLLAQTPFETPGDGLSGQKRMLSHARTIFLSNDTLTPLPYQQIESLALKYQDYQLAMTESMRVAAFGSDLTAAMVGASGHVFSDDLIASGIFLVSDTVSEWWIRSGTVGYPTFPELSFYQPNTFTNAHGSLSLATYYSDYNLWTDSTTDALGNTATVQQFDFRNLGPQRVSDANGTVSEVATDILGRVVGTAVYGKMGEGETLTGFNTELSQTQIDAFMADPEGEGFALLYAATTRFIYDLSLNSVPVPVVASISRTRNLHQPGDPDNLMLMRFEYSDGSGNPVMAKVQAEPGEAKSLDASNAVVTVDTGTALRWLGNGRTVINNKGNPIKQYEPYFSASHLYEDESSLVEIGVSPIMYYDALGRLIRTEMPNGTFSTLAFTPWEQVAHDANDTVASSDWYTERSTGALSTDAGEADAAAKALVHADTPLTDYLDSLGRKFYSLAQNAWNDRTTSLRTETSHSNHSILDISSNSLSVLDARGLTVIASTYNMLGQTLSVESMDGGARRMFSDGMGLPLYRWDALGTFTEYFHDALQRPTHIEVTPSGGSTIIPKRSVYGESTAGPSNYFRGKVVLEYDGTGIVSHLEYDYKGNLLQSSRQLCADYQNTIDWTNIATVVMEPSIYATQTQFDALNRPYSSITPDGSIFMPGYNAAGLLENLSVHVRGAAAHSFVTDIDYDEKGRRTNAYFGNGVACAYTYDPLSFRLTRIVTTRRLGTEILQDLNYYYDPAGNITSIRDDAQETVYFNNAVVEAHGDFTYDALYRLIAASGREHAGSNQPVNEYDLHRKVYVSPGDGAAMQNYQQFYEYDLAHNMTAMVHNAGIGSFTNQWTRNFNVDSASNRLLSTQLGSGPVEAISYDLHGNMSAMPHLSSMTWDHEDRLQAIGRSSSNSNVTFDYAWYNYDSGGSRIRKTVSQPNGVLEQRIYLGQLEIYTQTQGSNVLLRRETLHISDGSKRIALVETKTVENNLATTVQRYRYQLDNHLGTASVELDETSDANLISYEEYYPFGSSAYQGRTSDVEVSERRYRYTGMERDEESGLEYHSARYYAPWLCRWTAVDPAGPVDGLNMYLYVGSNPVKKKDPTGLAGEDNHAQLNFGQSPAYYQKVRATATGRGITDQVRSDLRNAYVTWGGDPNVEIHAGHNPTGTGKPFGLTPAGTDSDVYAQPSSQNMRDGATSDKALVQAARNNGEFARDTKGVDTTVEKGTQFGQPPRNPNFENLRPAPAPTAASPASGGPAPATSTISPAPGATPPSASLSAEVPKPPAQLNLFNEDNTPAVHEAPKPAPAPTKPAVAPTAKPAAAPAAKPAAAPAVRAASGTSTGTGTGAAAMRVAGGTSLGITRAVVPGVVEAEIALTYGSAAAYGAGYTSTGAALATGAAYVPVVGAGLATGAVVGNLTEAGVTRVTGSTSAGKASGAVAAAGSGAAVGALVGSVIPGVGTAAGAVVGGVAGLGGYYLSQYF